ncbi:hypothetical protein EK21DRAFT_107019 [Setomelanomma holmii]|uniref:Uncharacterized protein n=1 Tax=Setomelanomma holmii TaxID=210430 RepID=A0A9P4LRM1_9PLEO|nr:hypothetical protein EK21DRAFT_107019 [Setomelanomma holmii]
MTTPEPFSRMTIHTRSRQTPHRSVSEPNTNDVPNAPSKGTARKTSLLAVTEADIQAQLNAEYHSDMSNDLSDPPSDLAGNNTDSDETMASPSVSATASESEDLSDIESDTSYTPSVDKPLYKLLVRDIEDEFGLTRAQGELLHDVMQSEMKATSLLGSMNFHIGQKERNDAVLKSVFAAVKERLDFLETAGVGKKRLRELLWARARILNSNEKHNELMVRAGKVKMRADGTTYEIREDREEREQAQEQEEEHEQGTRAQIEQNLPSPKRTERGYLPSVIAAELRNLEIGNNGADSTATAEMQEEVRPSPPGSPMHVNEPIDELTPEPARIFALPSTATILHPTSFIVRVVNSTTGAAVHTSQLLPQAQQHGDVSVESLSYETFITLVSQQLGLDVRGRISGVVPKFYAIAPHDSKIEIRSEATWKAVLQAWQNTRRKTCEFVVEAE